MKIKNTPFTVLLGCILIQGGSTGILANCMAVFYAPIAGELGFSNFELSTVTTIRMIMMALGIMLGSKFYKKIGFNNYLTIMAVTGSVLFAAQYFFYSLTAFRIAHIFMGFAFGSLITIPATIMINNWFNSRIGFFLGLSLAASGVVGAVFSPLVSSLTASIGWRLTAVVFGLCALVMDLPATMFLCRIAPEGDEKKYGELSDTAARTVTGKADSGIVILLLAVIVMVVGNCVTQLTFQFSLFTKQMGMALSVAAGLNVAVMLGNTGGKIFLGILNDRLGPWKTILFSYVSMGIALFAFTLGQEYVLYVSAAFIGLSFAITTLIPSMVSRNLYSSRIAGVSSILSSAGTFGGAVFGSVIGLLSDILGGYTLIYFFFGVMCLACIVLVGRIRKEAEA